MELDKIHALVVDDSSTMVRIVSNTLKRVGIETITTGADGVLGLEAFMNTPGINLILTDINMPNMNGMELLIAIRKLNKDIPIVMITTEGGKVDVIKALKAGCNSYIIKPFTPDVLKEKLKAILEKS